MKTRLLSLGASFIMTTLPSLAQQTYADYNHAVDFKQFHTYAWGQGSNANQIANSFLAQPARRAVDSQLQAKGLNLVLE
jgi:hypothetical protein